MKANKIYRKSIIQHCQNPFNKGLIYNNNTRYLINHGGNSFCGDKITLQTFLSKDKILDIRYEIQGCCLLISSASMMAFYLKNHNLNNVKIKVKHFLNMLQKKNFEEEQLEKELRIFKIISYFPSKLICVSTPWTLLLKSIQEKNNFSEI